MFYVISKSLEPLTDPAILLIIAVLGELGAAILGFRRLASFCAWFTIAIIVLFGVLPGGTWLALPLETRFPANPPLPAHVAGIIALGGSENLSGTAAWGQPVITDPQPIAALISLGRRYPGAALVFSGGGSTPGAPHLTESDVVHSFLTEFGINGNQIIYEKRSRNTLENAVYTHQLVLPKPGDRWILVAEAISMPRAVGVFRQAGWQVIPFPAGYLTRSTNPDLLSFDLTGGLRLAGLALHEWVGLLVYRVMGYTDAFFPH